MRHFVAVVVVLGLLCCPAFGSSILGSLLTLDGTVDTINDNSRAVIFDNNNDGLLNIGDELVGVLQFEKINDSDPSPAGLYGIFSIQVTASRTVGGIVPVLDHGPVAAANAHSLKSLLDDALEPGSFTNWNSAAFAFVEIPSLGANDPKDPFSATNSEPGDNPIQIIQNVMTAANGYSLDAIIGFGDQDDFLSTVAMMTAGFEIGNMDGTLTIPEIIADDQGIQIVSERAGMSVLYDVLGASYEQLSVTNFGMSTSQHDIVMKPDGAVQTSTVAAPNWHLEDDANFQINPVPEPGTMTLLISLTAMLGLVSARRRK